MIKRCSIMVQVVPRSSRVSLTSLGANTFKIKLTSAPVDGAANEQLKKVLSQRLSIPQKNIEISSGEQARRKRITLSGIDEAGVARLLGEGDE